MLTEEKRQTILKIIEHCNCNSSGESEGPSEPYPPFWLTAGDLLAIRELANTSLGARALLFGLSPADGIAESIKVMTLAKLATVHHVRGTFELDSREAKRVQEANLQDGSSYPSDIEGLPSELKAKISQMLDRCLNSYDARELVYDQP